MRNVHQKAALPNPRMIGTHLFHGFVRVHQWCHDPNLSKSTQFNDPTHDIEIHVTDGWYRFLARRALGWVSPRRMRYESLHVRVESGADSRR